MAKKKGQQQYMPLCIAVEPSMVKAVDAIARATERNRSQTFRLLTKEGMKALGYQQEQQQR